MAGLSEEEARELLAILHDREAQVADYAARRSDLEVEAIVADVVPAGPGAMRSGRAAPTGLPASVNDSLAGRLVLALDRRTELHAALGQDGARERLTPEVEARYQEAVAALALWLGPEEEGGLSRAKRVGPLLLVGAVTAAGWAAWALHPAMLLLLVPVGIAVSFLSDTGYDAQFRQVGAQRRFDMTRLPPPRTWETEAVQTRLTDLQAETGDVRRRAEAQAAAELVRTDAARRAELEAELEAVEMEVYTVAREAGLEPATLSGDVLRQLRDQSRGWRANAGLRDLDARMRAARAEADRARETLFKGLAAAGMAPDGGHADYAVLAAGVERLASRDG